MTDKLNWEEFGMLPTLEEQARNADAFWERLRQRSLHYYYGLLRSPSPQTQRAAAEGIISYAPPRGKTN